MSNTERKVSIAFDAPGVQEFVRALKDANNALGSVLEQMLKSGQSVEDMASALKALGFGAGAVDKALNGLAQAAGTVATAQTKAAASNQKLIDLEITYQRAVGNTTKALELNAQAQVEAAADEARVLQLRTQQVAIEKEQAAQRSVGGQTPAQSTAEQQKAEDAIYKQLLAQEEVRKRLIKEANDQMMAARAQVGKQTEEEDLAKRNVEQQKYLALQKQQEETDLQLAAERAKAAAAFQSQLREGSTLIQKQIEETDLLARAQEQEQAKAATIAIAGVISDAGKSAGLQPASSGGIGNTTREARGLRDALFGAGLGISMFSSALGDKLPPAAQKASNSLRLVADTMLAVAFLAPESGPLGLAIGAAIGGIIALGAAAADTDPKIKALDDSLNKLGSKDDAIEGLAKLAKVTDANAEAAFTFLKANPQLVAGFKAQTDAAQGTIPVLQGVGDGLRALGDYIGSNVILSAFGKLKDETLALVAPADAAIQKLTAQTQAFADVQNQINASTSRVAIANAQDQIDKLREQGASVDELRLAMLKLLQLQEQLNGITPSSNGARNYAASPIGISQTDVALAKEYWTYIDKIASTVTQSTNNGFPEARTASLAADKLGKDILALNRTNNTQLQQLSRDHQDRLAQIAEDGNARRLDIERNYNERLASINDNLAQEETDASSNLAQSRQDAEDNAAQERLDRAADYAARLTEIDASTDDKRLQIEQTYQDKLRGIQEQYNLSLFDAVAHRDAKALIQAGMVREKAIAEAQRTHDKEIAAAQKQHDKDAENARIAYEKQMRDLEQALARQEQRLQQEYDRRIRDLEQAAQKQRDAAAQSHDRELQDQAEAQAKQIANENKSYKTRQDDLATALAERKQSLIDALTDEQDITERYAKAIVESLRGILAPDEIAALLNDVQKSLSAQIDITIKPFAATNAGGGGQGRAYAYGGYTGAHGGTVHANELVLPLSNSARTQQLLNDYMPRMNIPQGGRASGGGAGGGAGKVQVEVMLNEGVLSARIASTTDNVIATMLTGARGKVR